MNREQIEALDTPETEAAKIQVKQEQSNGDYHFNAVRVDKVRRLERRYRALKIAVQTGIMTLELRGNYQAASELRETLEACREIERD